jgi:hypothetical protein
MAARAVQLLLGQLPQAVGKEAVVDAVVEHASTVHRHTLDRDVVLAHVEGVHPFERDQ